MTAGRDVRTGELLLGRYRIEALVGRGGMGVVHRARDERLDRTVALKLITTALPRADADDKRPQKEARALARLNHPNLVTLLDYDELDDGTPVMVMEYVEGQSLDRLLTSYRFSAPEIALVLHQTAEALAACHEQGIIHRDLKPGNLLVLGCDRPGIRVKVIDFGLTKLLADSGATALTLGGKVFGSPRFMAPEQWTRGQVDGRTDLYALGLVGYCLVLGKHFIESTNPVDIFHAHMHGSRPPLVTTSDGRPIPPALAAIIERTAHPDASIRYPDARALQSALEPQIRGVQVHFSLPSRPPPPTLVSEALPFDESVVEDSTPLPTQSTVDEVAPTPMVETPDEDKTCLEMRAPEELLAALAPPASATQDVSAATPRKVAERVRFGFTGALQTAITKGDVERAVQASIEPGEAPPPGLDESLGGGSTPPSEVAPPADITQRTPSAAVVTAAAAAARAAATPPAPPRTSAMRSRWVVIGGGLFVAVASAIATILLLR